MLVESTTFTKDVETNYTARQRGIVHVAKALQNLDNILHTKDKIMSEATLFRYKIQIKEFHLDTFGHMNNAVYLNLYEEARWDFCDANDYGLTVIQDLKMGPVVLDVHCRFKREIHNREWITIESRSESWDGKIGKIHQKMIKEDGSVASEATFTVGFMDLAGRKLINPTDRWLKAVGIH
jgi:YbgC/YbaW family acyl-CoA thioester hydrolase